MTTGGGNQPKPPVRSGTLPGVSPAAADQTRKVPAAAGSRPQVAQVPKAAGSEPRGVGSQATSTSPGLTREEVRGVASAIARAEAQTLRDDLMQRVARIEERLDALERKPAAGPPPLPPPTPVTQPILPTAGFGAPTPAPAVAPLAPTPVVPPSPFLAPVVAAAAPLVVVPAPPASIPIDVGSHDDLEDNPFAKSSRRRKRMVILLVLLLVAGVGSIVVAAAVSQSINNHSGH